MNKNSKLSKNESYIFKLRCFSVIIVIVFLVLIYRLANLQIIKQNFYKSQALNNRKQVIKTPTYRGEIYIDEGKKKIVENVASFSIYLTPNNFPKYSKEKKRFLSLLTKITNEFKVSSNSVISILKKGRSNPYKSYLLKSKISKDKILYLAENIEEFPGIFYLSTPIRRYIDGLKYSHITGYIRPISYKELKQKGYKGYSQNYLIGKSGIEGFYDLELRGKEGYKIQIVDVKNRVKDEIIPENSKAIPGEESLFND